MAALTAMLGNTGLMLIRDCTVRMCKSPLRLSLPPSTSSFCHVAPLLRKELPCPELFSLLKIPLKLSPAKGNVISYSYFSISLCLLSETGAVPLHVLVDEVCAHKNIPLVKSLRPSWFVEMQVRK